MKRIFLIGSVVLTLIALSMGCEPSTQIEQPKPIEIINEENEEEEHKKRQEWIEQMHWAAPDVDWRAIDEQTRIERQQHRAMLLKTKSTNSGLETLADGQLTGRWNEKGSYNLAGRVRNIDVDFENKRVYAASDGGQIFVGGMNGENWQSLTDHYHVKGVHYFRVLKKEDGSNRLVQINHRPLFRYSDDEGKNWQNAEGLESISSGSLLRGVNTADGKIYLLFRKSGGLSYIYQSENQGSTFSLLVGHTGTSQTDIWTSRYEESHLFFADREDIYQITASGDLELVGTVGLPFVSTTIERVQLNGMVKDDVVHLAVMFRTDKSTRFFSSNNGGQSWLVKGYIEKGPFMRNSFGMSTLDPNIMAFGEVNAYRSYDGGSTWNLINAWGEYYGDMHGKLHADIPEIEFIRKPDGGELVYVSTDGGSYLSDDNLLNVKNISFDGLRISQYYSTYTHREKSHIIYVGTQDQGFQKSTEITSGIANFEQTISGDYGHIVSSDAGRSLWTVYPGFVMRYPDAASSTHNSRWTFTGDDHFWMPPLMEDPYFPDRVYLAGGTTTTGNHLWHLEDKGGQIVPNELPYDFSGGNGARISAMAYSPINKDYRYVLNSKGRLYYSSDRGSTWNKSRSRGPGSHYFYGNAIIPHPKNINTIFMGGSGYSGHSFWKSEDGGTSFKASSKGLPNTLIFELARNEDASLIFAATEVGPYVYITSEESWYDLAGTGAPEQTYWSVDYVPALKTARFGTYGRGIWDFEIASFTGVEENQLWANGIGSSLYPNPSDGYAQISYTLPTGGDVNIRIIDASGRLILSIEKGQQTPGSHIEQIDLTAYPVGLYFVTIRSGKRFTTHKLLKK